MPRYISGASNDRKLQPCCAEGKADRVRATCPRDTPNSERTREDDSASSTLNGDVTWFVEKVLITDFDRNGPLRGARDGDLLDQQALGENETKLHRESSLTTV